MISRHEHKGIVWVDLESPTHNEILHVAEEFDLTPGIAEELLLPSARPRVESHGHFFYLILHFPALRHSHKTLEQEVDFVVGKNFIITTRYDMIDPLHKFSKLFEVNSALDSEDMRGHAGYIFFQMVKRLYKAVEHENDFVRSDLNHIEQNIFDGHEVAMVKGLSRSARDLLSLRQTIEPHRDILRSLEEEGIRFFGNEFAPYLRGLSNDYYKVHNHVMRNTDFLHELRETNNSLLSTKENETMRILTLMALLTFPLALFVAIFDIDAEYNPIIGLPYDFWIIVGIVATAGASMLWYFRHKKWL